MKRSRLVISFLFFCTILSEQREPFYMKKFAKNSGIIALSFLGGITAGGALLLTKHCIESKSDPDIPAILTLALISTGATYAGSKMCSKKKKNKTIYAFSAGIATYLLFINILK